MKHIVYILILVFFSCNNKYSTTELKNNFSSKQIEDLNKIREFFIDQLCNNEFENCFKSFDNDSLEAIGKGIWSKIDFEQQKKIYDDISKSTFDEIWMYCKTRYYHIIEATEICTVPKGKYQNYLNEIGRSFPIIAEYSKSIENTGVFDILDLKYHKILSDKNNIDLNNPNIQLILAIHYLSINDIFNRNKDLIKTYKNKNQVSFISTINLQNTTKDGIYLNGYVVDLEYEKLKKYENKKVRISGEITIVEPVNNNDIIISKGRAVKTKHIKTPKIEIVED